MEKDYKFSVITAVYNAEEYIKETIESVIGQSIGFDCIQMILIDDGSTDGSGRICEQYAALYPKNIEYYKKENGGVSSARNAGIEHAKGKYVIFLDSDDLWKSDAFEKAFAFFEAKGRDLDVCSCRIMHIGDFEGKPHVLDYKFKKGNRIADLDEEPEIISSTIGNIVVKREAIGDIRFNELISVGEDAEFTNTILLNNPRIGIVSKAIFYYRRNYLKGSGSSGAPFKKSWYIEVPREYYLSLCKKSIKKCGVVKPFIQRVILYDLMWRHYNEKMMDVLTDEEKKQHIDIMHDVLSNIDYDILFAPNSLSNYSKLYFLNLKYKKEIILESILKEHGYWYQGNQVISFWGRGFFEIKVLDIREGNLILEGITRAATTKRNFKLLAKDEQGKKYYAILNRYEKMDFKGFVGETVAEAMQYKIVIPVNYKSEIHFYVEIEGKVIPIKADYDNYIGITKRARFRFCIRQDYLIRYKRDRIMIFNNRIGLRLALESLLMMETIRKKDKALLRRRYYDIKHINIVNSTKIRNRVVFVTVRSEGDLKDNLAKVYEATNLPKAKYAKLGLHNDLKEISRALKVIYSSKIVVTDDYLFPFRDYGKMDGQRLIQLWHATGAGKCFGQHGTKMFPPIDALYHKDYDAVTVSSEHIRQIYADAFEIQADKVKATGVARTDEFFDETIRENITNSILAKHPELTNKEVIIYVPTFRDTPGFGRKKFIPEIDFDILSKALLENQIIAICPHPVMTEPVLEREYDNIIEVRDVSTNDMMFLSQMLITDYSSVMFEYSLLNKPMAFYCYDYDDYDRDFYMDFDRELPGPLLRTQDELIEYLKKEELPIMDNYTDFFEKYMGSCDGHSTERIAKIIEDYYYDRT